MEELRRDLVFAARAVRRRPGFATVVVLTLVIGLASATTIFGVVYGVLWAPLPYAEADRIVRDEASLEARRHDYWALSHIRDHVGQPAPRPGALVRPRSVAEVQALLRWAGETRTAVIPFGLGMQPSCVIERLTGRRY